MGINKKQARSIGVAVDHRRRNRSAESLQLNSQRLKEYKAALIVFPKKRTKVKGILKMPELPKGEEAMVITDEMKSDDVFHKLRLLRADYRLYGIRQKNQLAAKAKE